MTNTDLLAILEEGLKNGRITPYLAAFIAAEVLDTSPAETGYDEWIAEESAEAEAAVAA